MTHLTEAALCAITILLLVGSVANAQCPVSVISTGLNAPAKIIFSTSGNLLIAEQGNGPKPGEFPL